MKDVRDRDEERERGDRDRDAGANGEERKSELPVLGVDDCL
jgi:hypothetical protein